MWMFLHKLICSPNVRMIRSRSFPVLLVRETVAWSALLATSCNIVLQEHSRQISRFQWLTKNQDEPYNCAQIKLTAPRCGCSLWEMQFIISAGDSHDQEQDSEQDTRLSS